MTRDSRISGAMFDYSKSLLRRFSRTYRIPIALLGKDLKEPITHLYAFLRTVDEIADNEHVEQRKIFLDEVILHVQSIECEKSLIMPTIFKLRELVLSYGIEKDLILEFLEGIEMDISKSEFSIPQMKRYVELTGGVVGQMALKIATNNNIQQYEQGKNVIHEIATSFQMINLIRDYLYDKTVLNRDYLHELKYYDPTLNDTIGEIEQSLKLSISKLNELPRNCRMAIWLSGELNLISLKKLKRKTHAYTNVIKQY